LAHGAPRLPCPSIRDLSGWIRASTAGQQSRGQPWRAHRSMAAPQGSSKARSFLALPGASWGRPGKRHASDRVMHSSGKNRLTAKQQHRRGDLHNLDSPRSQSHCCGFIAPPFAPAAPRSPPLVSATPSPWPPACHSHAVSGALRLADFECRRRHERSGPATRPLGAPAWRAQTGKCVRFPHGVCNRIRDGACWGLGDGGCRQGLAHGEASSQSPSHGDWDGDGEPANMLKGNWCSSILCLSVCLFAPLTNPTIPSGV
jgi:hypothetical protein